MKLLISCTISVLVILYNFHFGGADMYLAMSDMENLLEAEKAMIDGLEHYIKIEENKILELKSKVQEYQKEYTDAKNKSDSYILNPINAYLLTKHLTEDWKSVQDIISDGESGKIIQKVMNKSSDVKFPTEEDLDGAATALIRLQNIYNLEAEDVAKGLLDGINFNKELSANDCFQIGKSAYIDNDFRRTVHWMQVALEKLPFQESSNLIIPWVTQSEILGYLSYSIYKEGDVKTALELTKKWAEFSPDDEMAKNNIFYFTKEVEDLNNTDVFINATIPASKDFYELDNKKRYALLCRGDAKPTPAEERHLKCSYVHNNIPYLRIGPLKREIVMIDPLVLIFYDVIYDSEIEKIKTLAKPKLNRATVFGNSKPKIRISKTGWIDHDEDAEVQAVIRRAGLLSRLDMNSAEALQVCNYGIGGHYEPHVDYSYEPETYEFDRTATILFYLTDVQQGGATVFTELKRAVWPKKGSAVFWYNLYQSGEGNPNTRHASCPVITGTKWVANLWIHEPGQVCYTDFSL